jgi:Protein of unknown function (DUF1656)
MPKESWAMRNELDVFGVYVPPLFFCYLAAGILTFWLSRLLIRLGFYRFVWHRPLFDIAMYAFALGGTMLVFSAVRQAVE